MKSVGRLQADRSIENLVILSGDNMATMARLRCLKMLHADDLTKKSVESLTLPTDNRTWPMAISGRLSFMSSLLLER
jgi:hypothetical protein